MTLGHLKQFSERVTVEIQIIDNFSMPTTTEDTMLFVSLRLSIFSFFCCAVFLTAWALVDGSLFQYVGLPLNNTCAINLKLNGSPVNNTKGLYIVALPLNRKVLIWKL